MTDITGPYSPLKILHHPGRLYELRHGRQCVPSQVQLVISDLCNHACSFCAYRMPGYDSNELFKIIREDGTANNNPNRQIPTERAIEIIDDCRDMGVGAIQFTGGGEPTVHRDHHRIFIHALDRKIQVALVTNGDRLTRHLIERLSDAAWVRVSLDAGTSITYSQIRRIHHMHFDRVLKNIESLARSRDYYETSMQLGVGFVVTAQNWHEVLAAASLARRCGANNFRISGVFTPDNFAYHAPFAQDAAELCAEAEQLSTDNFQVINLYHDRLDDLQNAAPDYRKCGYMHFNTYIGGDLNVYTCCNNAYHPRGLIGSLQAQTFRQLWESDAKTEMFRNFDARNCPRCMFNAQNRIINYATDPSPRHANFV